MNESRNPYHPPPQSDARHDSDGRIELRGDVTPDDLVRLIGVPRSVYVMRALGFVFLTPFLVIPVVFLWSNPTQSPANLAGVAAMVICIGALLFAVDRMVSPRSRVKRLVKRHPGLVGPLIGYLDAFGLTFHNEGAGEQHQFSWAAFPGVIVTDSGIRLDWKSADGAFIAIPSRCIDGFDRRSIRKILKQHREDASEPAVYQLVPDWSQKPSGAISFQKLISAKPAATPREILQAWVYSIVGYLSIAGIAFLFFQDAEGGYIAGLVGVATVSQVLAYRHHASVNPARYMFRQWGWADRQGVQWYLPGLRGTFRWSDLVEVEADDDCLTAHLGDGSKFQLAPSDCLHGQVASAGANSPDWRQLVRWAGRGNDVSRE